MYIINEPRHDKTNKMNVHPAKTQISLGIRPVWSEPSLCTQWVAKDPLLAHLSQRLIWWAYRIGRPPSSVVLRRHLSSSTLFKHLRRNHWANQSQISSGASMGWGTKICSSGPGHMTKMATMPIYGKNLKKSSSPEPQILVCIIGCSSTTKFAQWWPWVDLDLFYSKVKFGP